MGGVRKVGRTPKVYEPNSADVQISIPQRQHDVLAEILLDAVAGQSKEDSAREAAVRTAHHRGEELGAGERERFRFGKLGRNAP